MEVLLFAGVCAGLLWVGTTIGQMVLHDQNTDGG